MPANRTAAPAPPPVARWTVADVLDFEACAAAAGDDAGSLDDRAFPLESARGDDRRTVFRAWLEHVRDRAPATPPGTRLARGLRLVEALAVVGGLVLGAGLVGGLLGHRDGEPVNALLFFGATVGVQLAVVALAVAAIAVRRAGWSIGFVQDATWWLARVAARAGARLDGPRRTALAARGAALHLRTGRAGPLLGCRLLIVTQAFAIAFNVGLLAAMLLVYLPFVELRFGWQSTYPFTADGVAAAVRAIAAPWSWLAPGLAPDVADVAATRYTRGQSATTLAPAAAHAWWPFLTMAIVVYGLLVRIAIAFVAGAVLRRRLAGLSFAFPAANALWRRLQGPLVTTDGGVERLPDAARGAATARGAAASLTIVDAELAASTASLAAVDACVAAVFGGPAPPSLPADADDDALPAALARALHDVRGPVVVVLAASRDPIVAIADFVRAVSGALRPDGALTLLLVADPADGPGAGVPDARVAIWRRFAAIQRLPADVEVARC